MKINVIKISLLQVLSNEKRVLLRRQRIINFIFILEKFALKTKSEILNLHLRTKTGIKGVYASYIGCDILSLCTPIVYILLNIAKKIIPATWILSVFIKEAVFDYIHPNTLVILYFVNKDHIKPLC